MSPKVCVKIGQRDVRCIGMLENTEIGLTLVHVKVTTHNSIEMYLLCLFSDISFSIIIITVTQLV